MRGCESMGVMQNIFRERERLEREEGRGEYNPLGLLQKKFPMANI